MTKLTKEEREMLADKDSFPPTWVTDKALSILDEHEAEVATLEANQAAADREYGRTIKAADIEIKRLAKQSAENRKRTDTLESELEALKKRVSQAKNWLDEPELDDESARFHALEVLNGNG